MKMLDKIVDPKGNAANAFFWQLMGPLFILCAFALSPDNLLFFCLGILGLFLCARLQMRGFVYSLVALAIVAGCEHSLIGAHHLWLLGVEGSYSLAFLVTALNAEQHVNFLDSLSSQLDAKGASIVNVEEELIKSQDLATAERLSHQEKIGELQKELEEVHSEYSSLLILNEVLRQTFARENSEKGVLKDTLDGEIASRGFLQAQLTDVQKEYARFKDTNTLVLQNQNLIDELNAARIDKEQARMMNETFSRLHAKEHGKVKELNDLLLSMQKEQQQLKAQLLASFHEKTAANSHFDQIVQEREQHKSVLHQLETLRSERNLLKERVNLAEIELARKQEQDQVSIRQLEILELERNSLQQRVKAIETELAHIQEQSQVKEPSLPGSIAVQPEEFVHLQEKVKSLTQIELLYKQLRAQFDEKNQVLHETRGQLFHIDTQFQALQMEMERKELSMNVIPKEIFIEVSDLEERLSYFERENEELQSLVSSLLSTSETASRPKRKKKVKTGSDQDLLFN